MLSQQEAKDFDEWLMSSSGASYCLPQLMEMAGLTIAAIISKYYPKAKTVFIAIGPGNNGGDGLVAARHLSEFNYSVSVYKSNHPNKPISDFFAVKLKLNLESVLFL